jgi:hypothetical protein
MTNIEDLRWAARNLGCYTEEQKARLLNEAADTIEDLCKQIDGCVRVAADALKRAGDAAADCSKILKSD